MQCSKLIWKTIPRATKLQIAKRLFSTFNLWVHVFGKLAGIENGNTKILLHAFQRIPTIGNILKRRRHGCPVLESSLGSAKTDSNDDIMCWRRGVGWANNKKAKNQTLKPFSDLFSREKGFGAFTSFPGCFYIPWLLSQQSVEVVLSRCRWKQQKALLCLAAGRCATEDYFQFLPHEPLPTTGRYLFL